MGRACRRGCCYGDWADLSLEWVRGDGQRRSCGVRERPRRDGLCLRSVTPIQRTFENGYPPTSYVRRNLNVQTKLKFHETERDNR